ncbi:hypothetical protein ACWCWD_25325 [Streptomyces sp. NPDC001493]
MRLVAEVLVCDLCQLRQVTTEEVALAGLATTARYTAEDLLQVSSLSGAPVTDVASYAMRHLPADSL